ncbi:hypothetical protein QJS04_geneDACA012952 [Acorus gramineus]|uniref:RNase H type-1 domain-containing protein n=1 Tax=Acorus gramineus TaxID=55184 RepID=A0AAV9B6B2_ACOGR|nr:hypothetical protein QJS04_geneDACA012952 [Acorus gramineus]
MELEVICMRIQAGSRLGKNRVIVCSDSQALVLLLQGKNMGPLALQDLIQQIRDMVTNMENITFWKVPRKAVRMPEALAKHGRRERSS